MDEMKIQENLVWDKHTCKLIGFVDLGDVDVNYTVLQEPNKLASHILVFWIRNDVNPFKFSLANFATTSATCTQMFLLVWKAINICELNNIKIVFKPITGGNIEYDDDKINIVDDKLIIILFFPVYFLFNDS